MSADPQQLGRQLARRLGGTFVPLSPAHGFARVVVKSSGVEPTGSTSGKAWTIDLTPISSNIADDLARRDFTVDAMALPLKNWSDAPWGELVIDPYNGREDLARKRIRTVTSGAFQENPGRLLRAVRLAGRLRFQIEPETARQIRSDAPLISRVSGERLRDEFLAILSEDGVRGHLQILDQLDLLCRVIPELAMTKGVDQPRVHYWDVWGHLLHTVEHAELVTKGHQNSPIYSMVPWMAEMEEHFQQEASDGHDRRTILKLAALFHDIAKPQTKQQDATGRTRFLGHPELGAEMATARLGQLRLSSRGIGMVAKMVEQHLRPANMSQDGEWPTNRAIYRYFRDLGDVAIDTLYLALADYLAAKGPNLVLEQWADHARMVNHILQTGTQQVRPEPPARLVTGHDLMQHFGISPGSLVGALLERIEEARATGEITTREEALSLAAEAIDNPQFQE